MLQVTIKELQAVARTPKEEACSSDEFTSTSQSAGKAETAASQRLQKEKEQCLVRVPTLLSRCPCAAGGELNPDPDP